MRPVVGGEEMGEGTRKTNYNDIYIGRFQGRAGEMALPVKMLATAPDGPSSAPPPLA